MDLSGPQLSVGIGEGTNRFITVAKECRPPDILGYNIGLNVDNARLDRNRFVEDP
jgi:hypothetical protein